MYASLQDSSGKNPFFEVLRIGYDSILVLYLFVQGFPVQEFWGGIWLDGYHADGVRMRPNRGVSRGDRGSVRGLLGVVLAYNFLLESKTYILVRWAFHLREPCDVGIRTS